MRSPDAQTLERVRLRDGAEVVLRPVRRDDQSRLAAMVEGLSEDARYRRFLVPKSELTEAELRYLTDIDHDDHDALVALDAHGGAAVGVARYIRDPAEPDVAEAAVVVTDDWQGRGLGKVLLGRLADRARANGVGRFRGILLAHNRRALALVAHVGSERVDDREGNTIAVEVSLPPKGVGGRLRRALGAAARLAAAGPRSLRGSGGVGSAARA